MKYTMCPHDRINIPPLKFHCDECMWNSAIQACLEANEQAIGKLIVTRGNSHLEKGQTILDDYTQGLDDAPSPSQRRILRN